MKTEKLVKPISGYPVLVLLILIIGGIVTGLIFQLSWSAFFIALVVLIGPGFTIVSPNYSCVLVLFGRYTGTIKENGFFWVNPFYLKKQLSLRAKNFNSESIKVNDKIGNPIMIGAVLVWKVEETFKAAFEVNEIEHFVVVQTEAALRKLAGSYSYDNIEDEAAMMTLRSGGEEVNHELEREIRERLDIAGIKVIEARINQLSYAQEIAGAMLRRQQASAVVAARFKIVEGAVSMVQMALNQLLEKKIVEMDEEKKAAMVSNLMVVLCGEHEVNPVINAGTLHQ
jgi:regulator of protease activity HflC (stomatin/prohibitin superfamily)